jgi:glycerol uptake facilitator-like aquaporin
MHGPLLGEFMGTMVLVLLGNGVVAKLPKKIALILPMLPNGAHDGFPQYEALINVLG